MSVKRIGRYKFAEYQQGMKRLNSHGPFILGKFAVNWFKLGFKKEGGQTDDSRSGWAKRKGGPRNEGRNILVDKGNLKRSIKIRKRKFNRIVIGTSGIPYARYHNEGDGIIKREFIGESRELERKLERKIAKILRIK